MATGGVASGGSANSGAGTTGSGGIVSTAGTGGLSSGATDGVATAGAGGVATAGAGGAPSGGTAGATGGVTNSGGVVEVAGLACGDVLDQNALPPAIDLGGRQVYIDYPCNKPAGTPVTFILNLHGTMDQESGKIYIRGYMPAYKYIDSHNFVIATPKSVVSQWGNDDGGQDEPHLMAVIDWVYANLSAFDIAQMWIVGHSWGAMYARTFACKTELQDKVHGVVLMSGGSEMPACADRLAALGSVGENDIVPGELTQDTAAAGHGCAAKSQRMVGNTQVTEWPTCDPGWVHRDYFMYGKGHGFTPDDWPEDAMIVDMVDAIAGTR